MGSANFTQYPTLTLKCGARHEDHPPLPAIGHSVRPGRLRPGGSSPERSAEPGPSLDEQRRSVLTVGLREAIQSDALKLLVESGTARDFLVRRAHHFDAGRTGWTLAVRQGARWLPVRSKRESIRVWAKLDTLEAYVQRLGVTTFVVDLA
jgi:hypothetical protein